MVIPPKLRPVCSVLAALLTLSVGVLPAGILPAAAADGSRTDRVSLPYTSGDAQTYEYLYLAGGYYSVDNGCPAWGTADPRSVRMIGDTMGWVTVTYTDGTVQEIPLVFGYTLWYHGPWQENSAPFKSETDGGALADTLRRTLSLRGAFEGEATCILRVKLSDKPLRSVEVRSNPAKEGEPILKNALLTAGNTGKLTVGGVAFTASDEFFADHTVNAEDPFPASVQADLNTITRALYTYEEDYAAAPVFEFPADAPESRTVFSGSAFANIATGSVYWNVKSLADRVDADGMMHTSYEGAPSWRYDGFGYWVENADSYYSDYYSRDGGRALMTLNEYGYAAVSDVSVRYANGQMMYFPQHRLTLGGVRIPGHFTVVINKPMVYSTVLVPQAGWGTQYTEAAFGPEYQNLGNQETDGHGLMMMANVSTWKNLGADPAWVEENWKQLKEAPAWIAWCFEHPDLSFVKEGLLYAESEAGMKAYTMYCNVPCMLGLYGYADMAAAAGHTDEAETWRAMADGLRDAIAARFLRPRSGTWSSSGFGFFHDPALTMLSDVYGYDLETWPEAFVPWITASRRTYASDYASVSAYSDYGAGGIGYHHSMITQNALLTDHMADATRLVENLCRISYSPRLPDPYIIPEGITYDVNSGAIRRQGDLGNLVQCAEAMKCFDMVVGISPAADGRLSITPRLPAGWDVTVTDRDVQNASARADMTITYPANGMQTASVRLTDAADVSSVTLRMGPFPADTTVAAASVNGVNVPCRFSLSGDSAWVYVTFDNRAGETTDVVLLYAASLEELGTFPASENETDPIAPDTQPDDTAAEPETSADTSADTSAGTAGETAADTETEPAPAPSGCGSALAAGSALLLTATAALTVMAVGHKDRKARRALTGLCLMLCLLPLPLLAACTGTPDVPEETIPGTPAETLPDAPAGTDAPADPVTDPATLPGTDPVSEPETDDPRVPVIIATAPAWETEPENPGVDPNGLTDLVKNNPHVTITASTTEGGNAGGPLGPHACFDGDVNTRWSSDQHDVDGCRLCLDFGYPVRVGGLYVNEVKIWGKVSAWEAQYFSEETGEWITVYEDESFTDGTFYAFGEMTPETYRFRLRFFESSSLAISLWEVNVMGIFAEVPEGTEPRKPAPEETPDDGIPEGLTDLAPSGTYTASSSENEGTPAELGPYYCFDGREDTRWSTIFHDLYESWIAVDFDRTVTVSGFVVNEVTNWGHVTSYSAQVLTDGEWRTVYDGKTFSSEKNVYIPLSAPASGTAFRLLFHDGDTLSETVTISEIRICGK